LRASGLFPQIQCEIELFEKEPACSAATLTLVEQRLHSCHLNFDSWISEADYWILFSSSGDVTFFFYPKTFVKFNTHRTSPIYLSGAKPSNVNHLHCVLVVITAANILPS
jgi:hypothetical protein